MNNIIMVTRRGTTTTFSERQIKKVITNNVDVLLIGIQFLLNFNIICITTTRTTSTSTETLTTISKTEHCFFHKELVYFVILWFKYHILLLG